MPREDWHAMEADSGMGPREKTRQTSLLVRRGSKMVTLCSHCLQAVSERSFTNDEAIEFFYRARAHNPKTTLKQIAERYGLNYANLLKHKQRYDALGKWGSKRRA